MSTRLVILGMLRKEPLHGYELKRIIEESMGDWTNIAFGSIYFALSKLTAEGLVEQVATEQDAGKPSRRIYGITEAGHSEFFRLLEALWSSRERVLQPLDIGLYFMDSLSSEKRLNLVEARIRMAEKALEYVAGHQKEQCERADMPPVAGAIFSHSLHHPQAELAWLRELEASVRDGSCP